MKNSSKTTIIWVIIIIILLVVIALVIASVYGSSKGSLALNQNTAPNQPAMQAASTTPLSAAELENGTYSLYGDTFTLENGQTSLQGHSFSATSTPLIPVGYTYAASGQGDLTGTGEQGNVVAMYRSFGANLEWVALFAVANNGTTTEQLASGIAYQNDSKVQSVNVDNGIITLNLLVISAADQSLPHYEQTPTAPLTLQFQIQNGDFVPVTSASTTSGKG